MSENEDLAWDCIAIHGRFRNLDPCEIIQTYGVLESVKRVKEALDKKDEEIKRLKEQ